MIYFDHSATTPVDEAVLRAMEPFFNERYGNASSIHGCGQKAALAVDKARFSIAEILGVKTTEVIFTSGATEANNLAFKGLSAGWQQRSLGKLRVVTCAVEHDSVLAPLEYLASLKEIDLTIVGVDNRGLIDLSTLEQAITPETGLVSVMAVNSEVGVKQPLAEIAAIVKAVREKRQSVWQALPTGERTGKPLPLFFHTDATQAVNFYDCNLLTLGVDLLSLSGHKIYGPKGVGALIAKADVPLVALLHGGHHERNLRSGTLNVPGIIGLATALELAVADREANNLKIKEVRDYLIERIKQEVPEVILNTHLDQATPAHAHFSFLGAEGEAILMALDLEAEIAVSTGSACASNTLGASKVLLAMGIKQEDTHGAIRFSLGKHNTKADIDQLMNHLPGIVKRFRDMAPDLRAYENSKIEKTSA